MASLWPIFLKAPLTVYYGMFWLFWENSILLCRARTSESLLSVLATFWQYINVTAQIKLITPEPAFLSEQTHPFFGYFEIWMKIPTAFVGPMAIGHPTTTSFCRDLWSKPNLPPLLPLDSHQSKLWPPANCVFAYFCNNSHFIFLTFCQIWGGLPQ